MGVVVEEEGEEVVEDGEEKVEKGEEGLEEKVGEVVEEEGEVVEEGRRWWRNGVVMGGVMYFFNKLFITCNTLFFCVEINFDVVLRSCTIFQTLCTQYPCHCL